MKTVGEQFEEWLNDPELSKFYHSRPEKIKQMIQMYPYEFYTISKYAPYGISGPGTIVELIAYQEISGEIAVVIHPQHLTEGDKEHIKELCQIHHQNYEFMISVPHKVVVEPKYLIPYE